MNKTVKFRINAVCILPLILVAGVILYVSGELSNKEGFLKKVDISKTCMASNRYAGKRSSAFIHKGKKYYGCSEMCMRNLEMNSSYRYATDPLTGKVVDKALAHVAADESGKLFYFESEENLKVFY